MYEHIINIITSQDANTFNYCYHVKAYTCMLAYEETYYYLEYKTLKEHRSMRLKYNA